MCCPGEDDMGLGAADQGMVRNFGGTAEGCFFLKNPSLKTPKRSAGASIFQ
jgi:hypothetical protein